MKWEVDKGLLRSLMVLGAVVEARDHWTGGHLWRMSQYCKLLAQRSDQDDDAVFIATIGGWLHDLGKIGIPDSILLKPSPLSPAESALVRQHPLIARDILEGHPLAGLAIDAAMFHHERFDGGGYPSALAGKAIPLVARTVAVADAFDAMTAARPYRRPMPVPAALQRLVAERGRQLDDDLVSAFIEIAEAGVLDGIVGHSDFETPLVLCPHCGPVLAIPRRGPPQEVRQCRLCSGTYRVRRTGHRTTAEPTDAPPPPPSAGIDLDQVDDLLGRALTA